MFIYLFLKVLNSRVKWKGVVLYVVVFVWVGLFVLDLKLGFRFVLTDTYS